MLILNRSLEKKLNGMKFTTDEHWTKQMAFGLKFFRRISSRKSDLDAFQTILEGFIDKSCNKKM